jgi:hypothetical protein
VQDEKNREEAERAFEDAKRALNDRLKEIKKRGLKGEDRNAAIEAEVRPLERARDETRSAWLQALRLAVPRPELSLGKRIDCTDDEYRRSALGFLVSAAHADRETLDLLAAFGSDACLEKQGSNSIEPTPFCFIRGSGHQYFLDTVRQLMEQVTMERVRDALFEPWAYPDETLSMRWDPIEDRRYALMDRDPTASDNKSRTVWMANLLAYRSLPLFPSAPQRGGLATTAWATRGGEPVFTWPIWDFPAPPDTIRSLLELRELTEPHPDRPTLRARGIAAAFRARRIRVGAGSNYKLNFSPARAV